MQSVARNPEPTPELVPLNVIRVETALSRYPVHRLAKQGTIDIEIREESEAGDVLIRWEVDYGKKHGQPGPLAYKLDTLIVNRRIEEASRPIPRIICLGSLHEICRELGLSEGQNKNHIKKALHQNASAYITAKLRYRLADGSEKSLEAGFTRYSVVFTGEKLSDGRTADAVYLELSDRFMQVINGAQTRPLDYDYLRDLMPASQRLYELLSFQVYAALKYDRPRAKLAYSEFCTYAPQSRYFEREQVRKQMYKVHVPHKKSGYIESVEFEQTTDRNGRPDWLMLYTPGPKAKAEYRAFTKRGGPRVLEVEAAPAPSAPAPAPAAEAEPTPLERELIYRGVTASTARALVREYPEQRIAAQVDHFDWLAQEKPKKLKDNPAGYLVEAIRQDYAAPAGFVSRAERDRRRAAEQAQARAAAAARKRQQEAAAREREAAAQVDAYLRALDAAALAQLDAAAWERADPAMRAGYERQPPRLRELYRRRLREAHVRALLDLPPSPDA